MKVSKKQREILEKMQGGWDLTPLGILFEPNSTRQQSVRRSTVKALAAKGLIRQKFLGSGYVLTRVGKKVQL